MTSDKSNEVKVKAPVKCAVIGLGMGKNHAKSFLEYEDAELVAVADLDEERLKMFEEGVGKDGLYTDYKVMLKEKKPDLVMVALPNFLHKPVTIEALESGANVLCEKPMAMTVAEAEDMKAAADASGKQLGINFSQRFGAEHRALLELSESGALGDIYHGYCCWTRRDGFPGFGGWFGQKKMSGGGPLIDLGVHRIDRAMSLMGYPTVASVSGTTHKKIGIPRAEEQGKKFDVEDFATGFVRFTNGASLLFEVSWGGHQENRENQSMRIVGTEGAIESQSGRGHFHHYRRGSVFYTAEVKTEQFKALNSTKEMVDCLISGRKFGGTPETGIQVQRILNGLYESAESGKEVTYEN